MYKLLLCWRYLLTRYLALICIISVMLGVATLIVVNSVMTGFSTKLKSRLHGLLSDVVIEANGYEGFAYPDQQMERIRRSAVGDKIEEMTSMIEVFALLQFQLPNEVWVTKTIHLIGIDPKTRSKVGGFAEYLVNPRNRADPSFDPPPDALARYRRENPPLPMPQLPPGPDGTPAPAPWERDDREQLPHSVIVGHAIASYRDPQTKPGEPAKDIYLLRPGDTVTILTGSIPVRDHHGDQKLLPVRLNCIVADYIKTDMSEYDSTYVYVPLSYLQDQRFMNLNHEHRVNSIQIKLKDYQDAKHVVAELRRLFPEGPYLVQTWEEKQGALLGAIDVEKGILNVLLFLIIAVAGFGILAIFTMIVTEKTRDIGILKALGASNGGVMTIFLGYGLLLGTVGAVLGTGLGLTLTTYINEIERAVARLTGQDVFPRKIYYFDKIPTDIQTWSVVLVDVGSVIIAVLFSILPALRAALLHPVRALRYE